jgi:cell division protein FtsL
MGGWRRRGAADEQRVARFHRERDRRRLRSMVRALGWTAVGVALVLGLVAVKIQQVRLSYRLDSLRAAASAVQDERVRLRVELASLGSLARIEEKARELGMVRPQGDQVRLAREFVTGTEGMAAVSQRRLTADRRTR